MSWQNIKFKALLFDMDGTLVDSMMSHNQAWIETLAQHGFAVTPEILFEYTGTPNLQTVEIFNERFGWMLDPKLIAEQKEERFLKNLNCVQVVPPVVEMVTKNFGVVPMAVVTGSGREMAQKILQSLDVAKYFPLIITAESTKHHKPHPEPFLEAARRLQVDAKDCLVFEDGELGIQAALAAGMQVVRVSKKESGFNLELV